MNITTETFALWESLDAVFEAEQSVCEELDAHVAPALNSTSEEKDAPGAQRDGKKDLGSLLDDPSGTAFPNTPSFCTRLEVIDAQLEAARRMALEQVRTHWEADLNKTHQALEKAERLSGVLGEMRSRCELANRNLALFRAGCEDAYAKRAQLRRKLQGLREHMEFWAELNRLSEQLDEIELAIARKGSLSSAPDESNLLDIITGLEVCRERLLNDHNSSSFLSLSPGMHDEKGSAEVERNKLKSLERKACELVRDHIAVHLRRCATAIATELSQMSPEDRRRQVPDREDAVTSLRFRRIAGETQRYAEAVYRLQPLPSPEAMGFRTECETFFATQRRQLVLPLVQEQIRYLIQAGELEHTVRAVINMLLRVCHLELELFQLALLPSSDATRDVLKQHAPDDNGQRASPLRKWLENLAGLISTHLLPRILQESDLGALVQCIDTLQTDILRDELPRLQPPSLAKLFADPVISLLADARERTIYRAQLFIRDRILRLQPTDDDIKISISHFRLDPSGTASAYSSSGRSASQEDDLASVPVYPAVLNALQVLSQLDGRIDAQVFAGLAREAVESCIRNLQSTIKRHASTESADASLFSGSSSRTIGGQTMESDAHRFENPSLRPQSSPQSSPRWDQTLVANESAEFFYLKQLLFLQEHLGLFGSLDFVDHEPQRKSVSFEELRNGISGIIRGQVSLRRLFGSVRDLIPRRVNLDSKELLREEVWFAHEAVVFRALRELLEPLLVFLAQVASMKNTSAMKEEPHSVASVDQVHQAWLSVQMRFGCDATDLSRDKNQAPLRRILNSWRRFFGEQDSQTLIEMLRENTQEALNEFVSVLHREYSVQERHTIGVDAPRIRVLMEALAPAE
jgi:hypothetical protein